MSARVQVLEHRTLGRIEIPTVLEHPSDSPTILLRPELAAMCDGNACAALTLDAIEQGIVSEHPGPSEVARALGGMYRARAVRTALDILIEKGIVVHRPRGDRGDGRYIPDALRWAVWERDDFRCVECGARRYLVCDHVHPFSKGGPTTFENLQTLCRTCNSRKGDR